MKPQKIKSAPGANAADPDVKIDQQNSAAEGSVTFLLKKSHGLIHNGRASRFYEAGTEFDAKEDGEVISLLAAAGAQIEQQ